MKWIILTMEKDISDKDGLNYNTNNKVKYSIWWTVTKLRWKEVHQKDKNKFKNIYTQKSTIHNVERLRQEKDGDTFIHAEIQLMKWDTEKCLAILTKSFN